MLKPIYTGRNGVVVQFENEEPEQAMIDKLLAVVYEEGQRIGQKPVGMVYLGSVESSPTKGSAGMIICKGVGIFEDELRIEVEAALEIPY